jgi:hypothetical protein
LYQVVRYEPKAFKQRRPNGNGGWIWNIKGVRRVLYRLPELAKAIASGRTVYVVEGEKDVDTLRGLGIIATCNPMGAKNWNREYNESLRGADVILVPDDDNSGYEHIQMVGAELSGGIAKRIRVLRLPSKDTSAWIAAGGTVEQLLALSEQAPEWMPPPSDDGLAEDLEAKKARAESDEQALIDKLARLQGLGYAKRRKADAKGLGINVGDLDREVKARREAIAAERGPPPLLGHWVVEPWPEEVDGDALIADIIRCIRRYVIITSDQAITVALWILMAWAHQDAAIHSPILLATSAEANSGKTTLLNLISFLVPRGMPCAGISEAALFRSVEMWDPTIIAHEADTILADNEPLRAVINTGYTRGSGVPRCIGDSHTPHLFPTFARHEGAQASRHYLEPVHYHRDAAQETHGAHRALQAH